MQRQVIVKPLVNALFAYLKQNEPLIERKGTLRAAFTYALNQEKYLRVFLSDGEVPVDNNASERAIRGFCIGRKNWQMMDTINGAKSSAIIYSITETAKANHLKPYDYFEYLLTEIPKHMADQNRLFIEDLLPWSPKLPESIRKPVK
ncbi:IS66 family transposase [Enterocloster bolteae]|uniref:IS66 family transposase n=1 Tax=Enterocloster bolteae TaxID=208479 RepID=UPI002ED28266